jgi:hypothetical protein
MPEEDRAATAVAPATSRHPRRAEGVGTNGDDEGESAPRWSRLSDVGSDACGFKTAWDWQKLYKDVFGVAPSD